MSIPLNAKAVVFTRYMFKTFDCSFELLVKFNTLTDATFVEGRVSGSSWDFENARGYLAINASGDIQNGYSGAMTITDMETDTVISGVRVVAGKVYKIRVDTFTSTTCFIVSLGCKYDGTSPLNGVIYSIKASGGSWGYNSSSAQYKGDLGYQFHQLSTTNTSPVKNNPNANMYPVTDRLRTGAVGDSSANWLYTPEDDTWTRTSTASGWGRLYLMKSNKALDGQRDYECLIRVTFHAVLNGKTVKFYYRGPGGSSEFHLIKEGDNDFLAWVCNQDKHTVDQRPILSGPDLRGVKFKNLVVKDSHGYSVLGANWVGENI